MINFNKAWLPLLISFTLVLGIGIGLRLNDNTPEINIPDNNSSKLYELGRIEEVLRFIEAHYVDSINLEKLKSAAIEGILSELDPHSVFIPKSLYPELQDEMNGQFVGIGIITRIIDGTVIIQRIREQSPSDSIGLLSGDRLIAIQGDSISNGVSYDSLNILLKGPVNSSINLTFVRRDSVFNIDVIRRKIIVNNVSAALALNDTIGYIKIDRFADNTYKDFMRSFEKLQEEHINELIIDIRGNTGGYLNETAKIVSQFFLQKDVPIAWSDGLHAKKQEYTTTGKPFYQIKDVVILVDENSASASEILAGAVQDLSRGVIIGRRTFGKGLVQEQYNLSDGSAFRLTVAKYYLPSGRSIQRSFDDKELYKHDWDERIANGELLFVDSIPTLDSTVFFTRVGKKVYSKRGIVPDIYIPYKSVELESNWDWLVYMIDDHITVNLIAIKDSFNIDNSIKSLDNVNWNVLKDDLVQELKEDHPDMINYLDRIDSIANQSLIGAIQNSLCFSLYPNNEYNKYIIRNDSFVTRALDVLLTDSMNEILNPD